MRSFQAALAAVSVMLGACGGNVVYVDGGGGGGTSTSSIPNTSSNTSMSSIMTDATSSQAGPTTACENFCAVSPDCFDPGACVEQCGSIYTPGCEAEADALIVCLSNFILPGCDLPPDACQFEINAYSSCGSPGCFSEQCTSDQFSCSCSGPCNGVEVTTSCKQDANGATCDCFFDGSYAGSCFQGQLDCDVSNSCCFFDQPQPGGP